MTREELTQAAIACLQKAFTLTGEVPPYMVQAAVSIVAMSEPPRPSSALSKIDPK